MTSEFEYCMESDRAAPYLTSGRCMHLYCVEGMFSSEEKEKNELCSRPVWSSVVPVSAPSLPSFPLDLSEVSPVAGGGCPLVRALGGASGPVAVVVGGLATVL